jgi:hypothetical protein
MKSLSFREMSALGSAVAVALMAYLYFPEALMLSAQRLMAEQPDGWTHLMDKHAFLFRLAAGSIGALIVLQIIYHILIGILWRHDAMEKRDERDRLVSLKAGRWAYVVLIVGVCMLVGYLLESGSANFVAAQYALLALFVSEFIRYAATFVYYRLSV